MGIVITAAVSTVPEIPASHKSQIVIHAKVFWWAFSFGRDKSGKDLDFEFDHDYIELELVDKEQ